mgnify:FL=1
MAEPTNKIENNPKPKYNSPVVIGAIAAGGGMALFMLSMGLNMHNMTSAVVQMGKDVGSMSQDMRDMRNRMSTMAQSMAQGQAGMSEDFKQVRIGMQ